jgi:prepilin-type processing-associated H-X9-DG protein
VKTSGLAIASLVLGILGFFTCGIGAIVGLILGIMAMSQVKKSNGLIGGYGIALAGTIISAVFLLMIPLDLAMLLPALSKAKQRAQTINCVNNMKQLALAARIYSGDHGDHFPPAATWCDAIKPNVGSERVFQCPAGDPNQRCHYGYNARLDGVDEKTINPDTVLFFEIAGGWNVNGGPELMLRKSRHGRTYVVAFADGSVQQMSADRLASLRWNP